MFAVQGRYLDRALQRSASLVVVVVGGADACHDTPAPAAAAAGCLRLNSTETWEQTNGSERRSKRCVM